MIKNKSTQTAITKLENLLKKKECSRIQIGIDDHELSIEFYDKQSDEKSYYIDLNRIDSLTDVEHLRSTCSMGEISFREFITFYTNSNYSSRYDYDKLLQLLGKEFIKIFMEILFLYHYDESTYRNSYITNIAIKQKKNPVFKMFIEIFGFKLVSKYQGNEDIVETYILVTEKGKIKTKVN